VQDIRSATLSYISRFGYEAYTNIIHDPIQTAYVQFLVLPGESSYLEFVSPDGPESKLALALKKKQGLNHICYSTLDIDQTCAYWRERDLLLISAPTEAIAFDGRKIAWFADKIGILYELVERRSGSNS
jgi:methylmalonyl-CoA/ethylmalonyl-CoA epimerase